MRNFRSGLGGELAGVAAAPPGDAVRTALRDGRRARGGRAVGAVAGSAVALVGVAFLLAGSPQTVGGSPSPAGAAAGPPSAVAAVSPLCRPQCRRPAERRLRCR
ncbi:hypothetical protein OG871_02835 [Kitasatospora sp. NBC_00374]|uniref:hypothetical protein n=1 Tax=Kitasatospora sp. NBC_00374 TaxID=2975964 RepID=UPI0030DE3B80